MSARQFLGNIGSKYKRVYVLFSSTGVTAPLFNARSLATLGGRMDVVARAALYALKDVEGCRDDAIYIAHLEGPPSPPKQVYIYCDELKGRSEGDVGEIIRNALVNNIYTSFSFIDLLDLLRKRTVVYMLYEKGKDILSVGIAGDKAAYTFIIGDQQGFPPRYEKELAARCIPISIGKKVYLASHVILYLNEVLDRILG